MIKGIYADFHVLLIPRIFGSFTTSSFLESIGKDTPPRVNTDEHVSSMKECGYIRQYNSSSRSSASAPLTKQAARQSTVSVAST